MISTFKGFNENMTCKGFKYEEGKEYQSDNVKMRARGFHACQNPIECLYYYPPNTSVYHEVTQDGEIDNINSDLDTIQVSSKIKIGKRLSIHDLLNAGIEYIKNMVSKHNEHFAYKKDHTDGSIVVNKCPRSASINTGFNGIAATSGNYSVSKTDEIVSSAISTGRCSIALVENQFSVSVVTDEESAAISENEKSASVAVYNNSLASSEGRNSIAASTGWASKSSVSGSDSVSVCTGRFGSAEANDPTSIAVAWGENSMARGVKGSHLVLVERKSNSCELYPDSPGSDNITIKFCPGSPAPAAHENDIVNVKMIKIDGVKYKENAWYALEKGEVVEVVKDGTIQANKLRLDVSTKRMRNNLGYTHIMMDITGGSTNE